ncbi:site-specific integrase [Amycolatopsis sp. DG1A-15b]|uniref:site-specific integrase n=1 Tax=Amycolatopsis sp. DG1A-15b TaxID=3052846 RepID=UPI00255BFA56|nr:site-specific integrase [Amycolatopsis sp. DG1A-15b]WIX85715.1 site-specific integrase [Amycolatopsis sp. DG1A-15b]
MTRTPPFTSDVADVGVAATPSSGATQVGPLDDWSIEQVVASFSSLPTWPLGDQNARRWRVEGARRVLSWLAEHPGRGWQERWVNSGADAGVGWIDDVIAREASTDPKYRRVLTHGLTFMLLARVVVPSYTFLTAYAASHLLGYVRQTHRPDLFLQLEERAVALEAPMRRRTEALSILSKLVLHTGRDLDQLTAEDFLEFRAWVKQRGSKYIGGSHQANLAWDLVRDIAGLDGPPSFRDTLRTGQRSNAELVGSYPIRNSDIREVLVRYLDQGRPQLDYSSLRRLVTDLVGNFWADIERHHPGIDTLRLPEDVAAAWKQRLRVITTKDGTTRPRRGYLDVLARVQSFYLDIQQWALQDPSWVRWAVPSPIRRGETDGMAKVARQVSAEMHQRVRERLPRLPALVETAERQRAFHSGLLELAGAAAVGEEFVYQERRYRRVEEKAFIPHRYRGQAPPNVTVSDLDARERIDVTRRENTAFWAWASIETLRHTGIRVEEMCELTHLALVSYQLPDTGEIVPMLQIVPSKSNEERLLLVGPELASVLATVITRLRRQNGGTVPLTRRYDPHDRVLGPPLPHLYQRRRSWRWETISYSGLNRLLEATLAESGLHDATGGPLIYTPHDFRRMFATEAATGGLPVHIVARLLGHANINTTQAYMAIFDEDLVRNYRAFLDRRRAIRPEAEYREPTEAEWREFQQHFQARKLELGECARPYGTPCQHEFACLTEMILGDLTPC